jgi:hypothetical protein
VPLFQGRFSCSVFSATMEFCPPLLDRLPGGCCTPAWHFLSSLFRSHFRRRASPRSNIALKPTIWPIFPALWNGPPSPCRRGKRHFWFVFSGSFPLALPWRKSPGAPPSKSGVLKFAGSASSRNCRRAKCCSLAVRSRRDTACRWTPCAAGPCSRWGETPEFLDAGGILCFSSQQGAIQFDVNLEAANKAHLKISSRLLALARHVVNQAEAAKS